MDGIKRRVRGATSRQGVMPSMGIKKTGSCGTAEIKHQHSRLAGRPTRDSPPRTLACEWREPMPHHLT
jgi:hypothetical protein